MSRLFSAAFGFIILAVASIGTTVGMPTVTAKVPASPILIAEFT